MSGLSDGMCGTSVSKQPLKRVEIALGKFNDVAVPHHVDLLRKHKNNIEKFQQLGDWDRMHHEQINATRLVKQLKALLYEMDVLRSQVQEADLQKFDKLTDKARSDAQDAIKEYLAMNPQDEKPVWIMGRGSVSSEDITKNVEEDRQHQTQMNRHISTSIDDLRKQKDCMRSWENLQTEIQDIHQVFEDFSRIVQEQKEKIDEVENNVQEAAENITEGAGHLAKATRYKATMYPLAGALLGGCLGGPVGLIAGIKLGGLAALGCGVIGFTGGQFLKRKQQAQASNSEVELVDIQRSYNLKGSVSLPHIECEKHSSVSDVHSTKKLL